MWWLNRATQQESTNASGLTSLQTSSVTVTPSEQGKSATVSRYLLTMTLFGNMGFTKTVAVSGVSL